MLFNYENFLKLLEINKILEKEVTLQKQAHIKTLSLLDLDSSPQLSIEAIKKHELSKDYIVEQAVAIGLVRSLN